VIDIFRLSVEGAIKELGPYFDLLESHTEAARGTAFEKVLDVEQEYRLTIADPGECQFEIEELRRDFLEKFNGLYPRSLRYSFLVYVVLVTETHLNDICDSIKEKHSCPISAKDLTGMGINRSLNYLKLVADVKAEHLRHREIISDLSAIRNCIVHRLGRVRVKPEESVDDVDRKILAIIKRRNGIRLSNERETLGKALLDDESDDDIRLLVIEPEFCKSVVASLQEFFTDVFDAAGFAPYPFKPRE
jgi:hypothetical protein